MELRIIDDTRPVAPGDRVELELRVANDGRRPQRARIRFVGLGSVTAEVPEWTVPIEPGSEVTVAATLTVPVGQSAGDHRVGVEAAGEDGSVALGHVTLRLASAAPVALSISPATVSGRRGGKFWVHLTNRGDETLELDLSGGGDGVAVAITPSRVVLPPGDRARLRGRAYARRPGQAGQPGQPGEGEGEGEGGDGPAGACGDGAAPLSRWARTRLAVGGQVHGRLDGALVAAGPRLFTVEAQGRTTPVRDTAAFTVRPLVPVGFRKLVAISMAMVVWAATLASGLNYLDHRSQAKAAEQAAAGAGPAAGADGAGGAGGPDGTAGGGDATAGGAGGGAANGTAGGGDPAAGAGAAPGSLAFDPAAAAVDVGGTIDLGPGTDPSGVAVTMRPVSLAAATAPGGGKVSALHAGPTAETGLAATVATTSNAQGDWKFANVAPGQYEVRFAQAGYVTQSHLVSVHAGDKPIELSVTLKAGDGRLAGVVATGTDPVGGAVVTITDGTVTYTTSTATTGDVGRWSVQGLATPGRYLVTVARRGFGTETQALQLGPGGAVDAVATALTPGVGSISGTVRHLGQPQGGVTVTATNGTVTRQTSSLTETDVGSFLLPELPVPGTWTLTVEGDGFITQTLDVAADDNTTGVVIQLVSSTAVISGTVRDTAGAAVSGVGVIASDGVHTYKTTSAIDPPGSYELTGVVPGSYVVSFDRFEYQPASSLATVAAGDVRTLDTALEAKAAPQTVSEASVSVSPEDAGVLVHNATVKLQGAGTYTTTTIGTDSRYTLTGLPVGTYVLTITHPNYSAVSQTVRLGPRTHIERTVALQALGDLFGVVTDTDDVPVAGATVQISFDTTDGNGNPTTANLDPLFTSVTGQYAVARSLGARPYSVRYSATGFLDATRTFTGQTGTSTELNVKLLSQPRISGTVRYRNQSGVPVALTGVTGMTVDFRRTGTTGSWDSAPVSAADGTYAIPNTKLTVGSWDLSLTGLPAQYATPTMPDTSNLVINENRTADINLPVNPGLSGTVRALAADGTLQPVANAAVRAQHLVDPGNDVWAYGGPAVTSAANGNYTVNPTDLAPGTWRLEVTSVGAGNLDTLTSSFALQLDTRTTRDVQVDANPQVAVTVKNKNASALANVTVTYQRIDTTDGSVLSTGTVTTDASGVARITKAQLTAGRWRFTVAGPSGLQDTLVLADQDLTVNQLLTLPAVLYPDPTVDGYVRRLNSSNNFVGVSGQTVAIYRAGVSTPVATVTSGAGGYFSFDPDALDPGDHDVVLGANLRTAHVGGLGNNDARTVELIVPQHSTVSGTLYWQDAGGQRHDLDAGAGWSVSATNVITDYTASTPAVVDVRSDLAATGTGPAWSVAGQAGGAATYTVTVADGRFTDATVAATVAPGTNPAPFDVRLAPKVGAISGLVTADGSGLGQVTVTLTPGGGGTVRTATTDSLGNWSLTDLVPGTYAVTVARSGHVVAAQPGSVTVAPNGSAVAPDGQLHALRTVTVTVASGGSALAGATVTLTGTGGPFTHTEATPGTHVFTGVPAGTYSLAVTKSGYAVTDGAGALTTVPGVTVAWGADPADTAVTLSQYGSITGQLQGVTAGNSSALIGYTVTATLQGGSGAGSVVTTTTAGPGGTFTLAGLRAGAWDVAVTAPGYVIPASFAFNPVTVAWNTTASDVGLISLAAQQGSIHLAVYSDNFSPAQAIDGATATIALKGSATVLDTQTMPTPTGTPPTGVTFADLDAGTYVITMSATGHADATVEYTLGRGEAAVLTSASTTLAGNAGGVVGTIQWKRSGGSAVGPLTGATIVVSKNGSEVARINQDPNNTYSFLLLRNGTYTVTVSRQGITTASAVVSVSHGDVTNQDFTVVAQTVAVTTSVKDDTGAGIGSATLTLAGFASYSVTSSTTNGSVGNASFSAVQPDTATYTLTATKTGYDPASTTVTVAPGGAVSVPALTLNRQGTATVTVRDEAGTNVANATVALTADSTHTATYNAGTGLYTLTNLPTGSTIGITVTAPGHRSATATTAAVTPGGTQTVGPVTVARDNGTIHVIVQDGGSSALAGTDLVVKDAGGTTVATTTGAASTVDYTGLLVASGPYTVTATKAYRATYISTATAVTDGGTATVTATLADRPTLSVTVGADPTGPANPSVTVSLRKASDHTFVSAATHSTATAFVFSDLPSGTYDGYKVVFSGSGYHPLTQVVPLTITAGLVSDATVSLVALGTIQVTVSDSNGTVSNAQVVLTSATLSATYTLTTGTSGVYTFTGLSAATDWAVTATKGPKTGSDTALVITTTSSTTVTTSITIS